MKTFSLLFCCLLGLQLATAQNAAEQKAIELIQALNKTEFVQSYREYKANIELDIAEFKLAEAELQPKDVRRVQLYYTQSKLKFDALLDKMEMDFSSKTTRKTIVQNPQAYTKKMQEQLTTAGDFYLQNCKKLIEQLTEKDSALKAEMFDGILGSIIGLIQLFKSAGENANQLTVEYLEKQFIQPLRLKRWEEIQ